MREPGSSEHLLAPGSSYSPVESFPQASGLLVLGLLENKLCTDHSNLTAVQKPQQTSVDKACPGPFVSDGELQAPEFILLTKQQQLPVDKSQFHLQTVDMGEQPSQLRPRVTWNKVTFKDTAVLKYYKHQSTTFSERLRQSIYRDCSQGGQQSKWLHSLCKCAVSNGKPWEKWSS